jgi:hypothetical protein
MLRVMDSSRLLFGSRIEEQSLISRIQMINALLSVYRAINYDKKNRNNNRDVNPEELIEFRKKFNCRAITNEYVDIGLFEEDNPSISVDI